MACREGIELSRRGALILLLSIVGVAFVVYVLATQTDLSVLLKLDSLAWIGIAALTVVYILLSTWLSRVLLQTSGVKPGLVRVYLVLTASMWANYAAPVRLGLPVQIWLYRQVLAVPVPVGVAVVAVEFFLSLALPLVLSIIGSWVLFNGLGAQMLLVGGGIALLTAMLLAFWRPQWFTWPLVRLGWQRLADRVNQYAHEFQAGLHQVSVIALVQACVLLALMYLVSAWRLSLILGAFGAQVSVLNLTFAQLTSFILGSLSMLPMGLGVRDASLTFLLTWLGVPLDVATSAAVIERVATTGITALLGFASLNILGMMGFKIREQQRVAQETAGDGDGSAEKTH